MEPERPADDLAGGAASIADSRTLGESQPGRSEGLALLAEISRLFEPVETDESASPKGGLFTWGQLTALHLLGKGSFGSVYAAWDPTLHREVALKLRNPEEGALRWLDEARALAAVRHRNVLTVYGAELRDARAGIWTELVEGRTLEEELAERGRLDEDEVTRVGYDLASALTAVHATGVVHGDVKTTNVMIAAGEERRVVLMDFGSAHVSEADDARPLFLRGTPLVMAPEVVEGAAPSPSSDVYALGVLLFRLLTGEFPVVADSLDALRRAHRDARPARVREKRPGTSKRLASAIDRALAPSPAARWPSASLLARELAEIADPALRVHRRARRVLVVAGACALIVVAVAAWFSVREAWSVREPLPRPTSPWLFSPPVVFEGVAANGGMGWMGAAGDVNGDGFSDVILADQAANRDPGDSFRGRVSVFPGSRTGPSRTPSLVLYGTRPDAQFGDFLVTADVDADGYEDLLVRQRRGDRGGMSSCAFLYKGSARGLATTPSWKAYTAIPDDPDFGPYTALGDVNGDSIDDVVLGDWMAGDHAEGVIDVYLGSTAGLASKPAWSSRGGQANDGFPGYLGRTGDVNGDGYDDLVVGANTWDAGVNDCGQVRLFLGGPRGLGHSPVWTYAGREPNAHLGYDAEGAGDVNNDGYDDLLVSETWASRKNRPNCGRALLFLGGPRSPSREPVWSTYGAAPGAVLGWSLSGIGDVDGDGYDDVAIGAPEYDEGGIHHCGVVEVVRGGPHGLDRRPAWWFVGEREESHVGRLVLSAGDVNGDGHPDLLVGSPDWRGPLGQQGRTLLFLGRAHPRTR